MFPKISYMITYNTEDISFNLNQKRLVSKWLKTIAQNNGYKLGDLNYIFCSDVYLLEINKQYLGHNYYTDIITFDYSDDYKEIGSVGKIYGDIYVSIDTVMHNAEEYGEGFDRELHRVIVHGLLHLIGFDDVTPELETEMHHQEDIALDILSKMRDDR